MEHTATQERAARSQRISPLQTLEGRADAAPAQAARVPARAAIAAVKADPAEDAAVGAAIFRSAWRT